MLSGFFFYLTVMRSLPTETPVVWVGLPTQRSGLLPRLARPKPPLLELHARWLDGRFAHRQGQVGNLLRYRACVHAS